MLIRRIFLVNQSDESHKYGVGKYISEIANEVKLRKNDYQLIIITLRIPTIRKVEMTKTGNIIYLNFPKQFFIKNSNYDLSYWYSKAVYCLIDNFFHVTHNDTFHLNNLKQYYLLKEIRKNSTATILYTIHVSLWKVYYDNDFSKFLNDYKEKNNSYIEYIQLYI